MYTSGFFISCAAVAVISYLLGSLNFGVILSKAMRDDDVRKYGSGNAGMTNVLRVYGKKLAALTTIGDFGKSVAAIFAARLLFELCGYPAIYAGYVAGFFALLGHLFPVYFGFRGGKGALTVLGLMLMINPIVFIIICAVCIPIAFFTRIVSLASVTGAAAFPALVFIVRAVQGRPAVFETVFAALMGAIVILVHRDNIKRLLNGTENKFGKNNP
ncbi:MAG: glycerol-3-phosphate 1-O-acyltransferase PlsY [Oscillospiraceae bacterium]|nr:glycerol-3-phosphate 1-O-acyltransferase PlsY [Oscillospiraceae bacterium]